MTLARLKELVKKGELHYIQLGGGMGGGPGGGGDGVGSAVTAWVRKHGTAVEESAYGKSTASEDTADSSTGTGSTLYRLDPSDTE
jgi:hypothetical protein